MAHHPPMAGPVRSGTAEAPATNTENAPSARKGLLRDHHLDRLEHFLDQRFRIPGIPYRFGMDGILGLIPGIGDVIGAGLSGLFIADAWMKGARKRTIARMVLNAGIDLSLGAIPVIGDLFDFGFKANSRNLALLRSDANIQARSRNT